ncbi:MAG: hypothetical protein HGA85_06610 [Nanoarchaeota archaeon]|nr:hypothetical protein [Nanoarchaeota archaeon]
MTLQALESNIAKSFARAKHDISTLREEMQIHSKMIEQLMANQNVLLDRLNEIEKKA